MKPLFWTNWERKEYEREERKKEMDSLKEAMINKEDNALVVNRLIRSYEMRELPEWGTIIEAAYEIIRLRTTLYQIARGSGIPNASTLAVEGHWQQFVNAIQSQAKDALKL